MKNVKKKRDVHKEIKAERLTISTKSSINLN